MIEHNFDLCTSSNCYSMALGKRQNALIFKKAQEYPHANGCQKQNRHRNPSFSDCTLCNSLGLLQKVNRF